MFLRLIQQIIITIQVYRHSKRKGCYAYTTKPYLMYIKTKHSFLFIYPYIYQYLHWFWYQYTVNTAKKAIYGFVYQLSFIYQRYTLWWHFSKSNQTFPVISKNYHVYLLNQYMYTKNVSYTRYIPYEIFFIV